MAEQDVCIGVSGPWMNSLLVPGRDPVYGETCNRGAAAQTGEQHPQHHAPKSKGSQGIDGWWGSHKASERGMVQGGYHG